MPAGKNRGGVNAGNEDEDGGKGEEAERKEQGERRREKAILPRAAQEAGLRGILELNKRRMMEKTVFPRKCCRE